VYEMAIVRKENIETAPKKVEGAKEAIRTKVTAREAAEKPSAEKRLALMRLRKERIEELKSEGR